MKDNLLGLGIAMFALGTAWQPEPLPRPKILTCTRPGTIKWKGKVCIRSSSNTYNLSLLGSIIAAHGEKKAEDWARAATATRGGDLVCEGEDRLHRPSSPGYGHDGL